MVVSLMFTDEDWYILDLKKDLDKIHKFLLLQKKDENLKIFLCGESPYINIHSDLSIAFNEKLDCGNFEDYILIGAGDMTQSYITGFKSTGYSFRTTKEVSLEIINILKNPSILQNIKDTLNLKS